MTITKKIDIDEAVELYEAGATCTELAARYGIAYQNVLKALRRAGVVIRPPRRGSSSGISDEAAAEIVAAYQAGHPLVAAGAHAGVSRSTAQRIIGRAGIKTRPHGLRAITVRAPNDLAVLGYFAGLLDGEGNLQLRQKKDGGTRVKIAIYSTTGAVMDWLEANIGGTVHWDTKRTERHGWKPIGIWEVYRAQDVQLLLRAALPYLIIKREAAVAALEYLDAITSTH